MDRNRLPIAAEGIPFVAGAGAVFLLVYLAGWMMLALFFMALTLFIVWFFRNPERNIPPGKDLIVSPADGRIIAVNNEMETRILRKRLIRISIFMNLFNVHVNRIPCSGRVLDISYNPGRFLSANRDKASLENEQNAVVLETTGGDQILFVQIAGLIARRIVCRLQKGAQVERGERFGLIRFGSRVDVYLPMDAIVKVSVGQKVKGGESILASLEKGNREK